MPSKKITTFAGIKKGQKFRVTTTYNGHNYPLNTVLTFSKNGTSSTSMSNAAVEVPYGNTLYAHVVEVITTQTLEELKNEKVELEKNFKKEMKELEEKIKICEENDLEEFDEDFVKVYKVLKVVEGKKTRAQKAKAIAELIK